MGTVAIHEHNENGCVQAQGQKQIIFFCSSKVRGGGFLALV